MIRLAGIALALTAVTGAVGAQPLLDVHTITLAPVFESWSMSRDGFAEPTSNGASTVQVTRTSQWSIPFSLSIPISRWTVDVAGAYAHGEVTLAHVDPTLGVGQYELDGLTDLRIRLSGPLIGDRLFVTARVNLPSGTTDLNSEQLSAVKVLAAPALNSETPVLGLGLGGAAGLVLAEPIGGWALAVAGSYEMRSSYTPLEVAAGLSALNFSPGDAVHVSLGLDGFIGPHGMTATVSADFFTAARLTGGVADSVSGPASVHAQLGPVYSANWQLQLAVPGLRELTVYASDHYRTSFSRAGSVIAGSAANYADVGVRIAVAMARSTTFDAQIFGRDQTGDRADSAMIGAGAVAGGLLIGVGQKIAGGFTLEPFVRGQAATLRSVGRTTAAYSRAAGLSFRYQF